MGENTRKNRRAKVLSMTVRYRSATLGEFIEHHSYDVSKGGMFIKTPSPFPPGTLLKFEVKIADEQRVMQGVGRVVWKRDEDGPTDDDPAGMGIKFIKIDDASRTVIDKLVDERGEAGPGAFEKSPESRMKKMFPDAAPAEGPAPEDQTVMKPASQLLEDALKKAGEDDGSKSRGSAPAAEETKSTREASSPAASAVRSVAEKESRGQSGSDESMRSSARSVAHSAARRSKGDDEEGGGGRAIISLFVVLLVALGVYIATKSNRNTEPPLPAEPARPRALQLDPPPPEIKPEPEPEVPAEDPAPAEAADDAADDKEEATKDAEQAAPVVPAPKPAPAPVPKPAPPPAPKPAPAPVPKPAPAPAPKPAPAPEPSPAPVETTSPAPAPLPTPAPAPAPTPSE